MPEEVAEAPELGLGSIEPAPDAPEKAPQEEPLLGESQQEASAPEPEATTDAEDGADAFDWSNVSLRSTKPEDVPEQFRDHFTRMQDEYKKQQKDTSREFEDLRQERQRLERQRQDILDMQKGLTGTPQQQAATVEDRVDDIDAMLADPDLGADERRALTVFQNSLNKLRDDILGQVRPVIDEFGQVKESVTTLTQSQREQREKVFWDQVSDAQEKYDDLDQHTDFITRGLGVHLRRNAAGQTEVVQTGDPLVNPATGKPHTVETLYKLVTGLTAQEALQARDEDARIKADAKKKAASPASSQAPPATGTPSEKEALDMIRNLGFGRGG